MCQQLLLLSRSFRGAASTPANWMLALWLLLVALAPAGAQTLLPDPNVTLDISGQVTAVVVQADGKVVIGGYFTRVNGVARRNLARFNADGTLDSWDPAMTGTGVTALALSGSNILVGGAFTAIGGASRENLAAIATSSGLATAWNPAADGDVRALVPIGGVVYVGGSFANVGGTAHARLAAVDATTGVATAWNPGADADVLARATWPTSAERFSMLAVHRGRIWQRSA